MDEEEIILITDGFDSLILDDEDTILKKFYKIKKDKWIVYAHDHMNFISQIEFGRCNGKSINAGSFIGRVKELVIFIETFLKFSKEYETKDDQKLMVDFCKSQSTFMEMVELDDKNILFCRITYSPIMFYLFNNFKNTIKFRNIQIKDKKIWDNFKKTHPSVLFAPGNNNMDDLVEHLGYDFKNKRSYFWGMIKERWVTILILLTLIGILLVPIVFLFIKLFKKIIKLYFIIF